MTLRDQVWDTVLRLSEEMDRFEIQDLPFDKDERHVVRKVLLNMEEFGWLTRETPHTEVWEFNPERFEHVNSED